MPNIQDIKPIEDVLVMYICWCPERHKEDIIGISSTPNDPQI